MSKIQEFIDAWNTEVDVKIATSQENINKYLAARQTATALTVPFVLKMPDLKYNEYTISGFDVTTLGQLFEWSYPIDGDPIVDKFGNHRRKAYIVSEFIPEDDAITDTKIYVDGYTYGTMSYLAQQYKKALQITSQPTDVFILESVLKDYSDEFVSFEALKKLKTLGGKAWFDAFMHSIYYTIFGTKISISTLKYSDYNSLSGRFGDALYEKFLPNYYNDGYGFNLGAGEQSKYYQAIIEAGDGFFPSQTSATQSGTQSGLNTDYTLSVINPLSDIEKKVNGKIVFIESGNYIIPNSTLNGLPNPWTNPKNNVVVPNNTGTITFNGGKSTSSKNNLATDAILALQNIIEGTYGLAIYLKYTEPDGPPVIPPSDPATGSSASNIAGSSASVITGASESSIPGVTASTVGTQEFTFNVEQVDIFSNADFGNLFIIGQEDETLLYDDGVDYSEYSEDQFTGSAENQLQQMQDLAQQQVEIDKNDVVERQRENAAKEDTGDTTSAPIKGSPLFKTVLSKAGYKEGTLEYEFALTIATKEGWLPNANNGRGSRAYRNNNPGNLDYSEEFKKIDPNVTREPGKGSRFARFSTAELGVKALVEGKIKKWASGKMPVTSGNQKLIVPLSEKWIKGTPPTLAQFMYTYAPPNENDTEGYLKNVVAGIKKVHSSVTRASKVKEYIA